MTHEQTATTTGTAPVRLRAGVFPAVNAVLAVVFLLTFAATVVYAVAVATGQASRAPVSAGDQAWAWFGALVGIGAVAAMVSWLVVSVAGLRPVVVLPGPGGTVSLPVVHHGFVPARRVVPLARVSPVLEFGGSRRNKRWRLVVRVAGGANITCDSLTSSRGLGAHTRDTPAGRAVRRLDQLARAARG